MSIEGVNLCRCLIPCLSPFPGHRGCWLAFEPSLLTDQTGSSLVPQILSYVSVLLHGIVMLRVSHYALLLHGPSLTDCLSRTVGVGTLGCWWPGAALPISLQVLL